MPTSLPEWPNTKLEAFKYTNLSKVAGLEPDAARSKLRHNKPAGVSVSSLLPSLHMPDTPLVQRALAQSDNDWQIDVEGSVTEPLEFGLFAPEHSASAPKLGLRLAENAHITIYEDCFYSAGSLCNALWQIELAEGAQLTHIRLQHCDDTSTHLCTSAVNVGRNAHYNLVTLNMGAALSRYEPHITLTAPGADVSLTAINLLTGSQQGDVTSIMHHSAPQGSSRQMIRSVLAGSARCAYQGRILVAPDAQKTSARQSSKALLLSPGAEMNTKPELEIFADDVSCAHGATTGSIDRNALYYLQSRGVPELQARALLVSGFVTEALDNVINEKLRLLLEQQIANWMERVA